MKWNHSLPIPEDIAKNTRVSVEGPWGGASYEGILNPGMILFKRRFRDRGTPSFAVYDYDPLWEELANDYIEKIQEDFKEIPWFIEVQHVGSTSVKGMAAKPIIELIFGYDPYYEGISKEMIDDTFLSLGYKKSLINSTLFWRSYSKAIYIRIVPHNLQFWESRILFRDFLVDNPQERIKYSNIKKTLMGSCLSFYEYTYGKQKYFFEVFSKLGWSIEDMIEAGVIKRNPYGLSIPMVQIKQLFLFPKEESHENH